MPTSLTPPVTDPTTDPTTVLDAERADLLATLGKHRHLLRFTVRDLDDEQAARRSTVSALCLGGLIKHVATTEAAWARFVVEGPAAMAPPADGDYSGWLDAFRMVEGETLAGLVERYEEVARATDTLIAGLPDLNADQPLPPAPWFEPGARWSARRVVLHLIAETSQHAGHADILREAIDGARSMG